MYDVLQVAIKLVGTFIILYFAVQLWQTDIDVAKLLNPLRWIESSSPLAALPSREPNALYQEGQVVARASLFTVDEAQNTILFEELTNAETFQFNQECEFQRWRIQCTGYETQTGLTPMRLQHGTIYTKATCTILGTR